MKIEISIDDGGAGDVRVAEMLEAHGFRGLFFVPIDTMRITLGELNEIAAKHDIGGHTMTHPQDLKLLSDERLRYEIFKPFEMFDMILKKKQPIMDFCYPRGRFDQRVKDMVKEAGYSYARTTRIGNVKEPIDPYEVDTTVHIFQRPELGDETLMHYFERMLDLALLPENGYYSLWMHSAELETWGLWPTFEKMLKILSKHH